MIRKELHRPDRSTRSRSLRALGCLAAAVLAVFSFACDSPTGPGGDGKLALGTVVDGRVAAGDTAEYTLSVKAGQIFVAYIEGRDGPMTVNIFDPTGRGVAYSYHSGPRSEGVRTVWIPVLATATGVYRLRVTSDDGTGGRFVLRLSLVDPAPEHGVTIVAMNDTVEGETIDQPADVDDFAFDGKAGDDVNVFLQALSPSTGTVIAELTREPTSPTDLPLGALATVSATGGSVELEANASGRVTLPSTGRYRLHVHSGDPIFGTRESYIGAYRFEIYNVNRAPEHAVALLVVGDTLTGERIDRVGDVDEFTLAATPGTEWQIFAEAGPEAHALEVRIGTPGWWSPYFPPDPGTGVRALPGEKLLDAPTGRFVMPASGRIAVTVSDQLSSGGLYRGPYRLLAYPIDRRPEGAAAELAPSGTPVQGAIDQYGDVDEYRFVLDAPKRVELLADTTGAPASKLNVTLRDDAGAEIYTPFLGPGAYRAKVLPTGGGVRGTYRGPYRFVLATVEPLPESASATLAPGDEVTVETSVWPHDSDRFRLASLTADTVQLVFTRPPGDSTWERIVFVNDAATGKPRFWSVNFMLGDRLALPRIDLAPGDAYDVVLEGYTRRWTPGADAPFGLAVRRVSAAPEHHVADIAFGDTVRDSIDYPGDIDDFILRGTPGQEINVSASWPSNYAPIDFGVALDDPATGRTLARSNFLWNYSPTATIPAGGVVRVRACSNASCAVPHCEVEVCRQDDIGLALVHYWLVVHRIDRAPEQVSATYALGEVVSGEKVDQPGDIDEYTFDGSAGQTVQAALQWYTPFDRSMPGPGLQLDLIEVASGRLLTSVVARYKTVEVDEISSPPLVLPTTGRYLVRVRSQDDDPQSPYIHNYGEYRFRVGAPR